MTFPPFWYQSKRLEANWFWKGYRMEASVQPTNRVCNSFCFFRWINQSHFSKTKQKRRCEKDEFKMRQRDLRWCIWLCEDTCWTQSQNKSTKNHKILLIIFLQVFLSDSKQFNFIGIWIICVQLISLHSKENVQTLEPTKLPVLTYFQSSVSTLSPEAKADKLGPDNLIFDETRSRLLLTVNCDAWVNSTNWGIVVKICVCRQMETFSSWLWMKAVMHISSKFTCKFGGFLVWHSRGWV